ncbi:hypothetical protein DFH29DRAFT_964966 [Suillus ampliporus]|nr:hypothetical protein DFH29DRAFT_964966 [Suillus ampliporus]
MTYLAKMSCHPGAVRWAAPEVLTGEELAFAVTTQSDIYSFGSIMLQVLTGNVPWGHLIREFQISYQVIIEGKKHPRPDDDRVTDELWNFMTCCWSMTPTDRPSAKEALQFVDTEVACYDGGGANGGRQHLGLTPVPLFRPPPIGSPSSSMPHADGENRTVIPSEYLSTAPGTTIHSTSPQTPISSMSSNERHPSIARNDYLQGDADARLAVMHDFDSPLDTQETHPGTVWRSATSTPDPSSDDEDERPTSCTNCQTTNTPIWRRDPEGQPLCNACGLFFKLHGIVRPLSLKTDVIKKRNRAQETYREGSAEIAKGSGDDGDQPATSCTNCQTTNTPIWRRDPEGEPLCNACGLFFQLHGIVRPLSLKTDVIKKRKRASGAPNGDA